MERTREAASRGYSQVVAPRRSSARPKPRPPLPIKSAERHKLESPPSTQSLSLFNLSATSPPPVRSFASPEKKEQRSCTGHCDPNGQTTTTKKSKQKKRSSDSLPRVSPSPRASGHCRYTSLGTSDPTSPLPYGDSFLLPFISFPRHGPIFGGFSAACC